MHTRRRAIFGRQEQGGLERLQRKDSTNHRPGDSVRISVTEALELKEPEPVSIQHWAGVRVLIQHCPPIAYLRSRSRALHIGFMSGINMIVQHQNVWSWMYL